MQPLPRITKLAAGGALVVGAALGGYGIASAASSPAASSPAATHPSVARTVVFHGNGLPARTVTPTTKTSRSHTGTATHPCPLSGTTGTSGSATTTG